MCKPEYVTITVQVRKELHGSLLELLDEGYSPADIEKIKSNVFEEGHSSFYARMMIDKFTNS